MLDDDDDFLYDPKNPNIELDDDYDNDDDDFLYDPKNPNIDESDDDDMDNEFLDTETPTIY